MKKQEQRLLFSPFKNASVRKKFSGIENPLGIKRLFDFHHHRDFRGVFKFKKVRAL